MYHTSPAPSPYTFKPDSEAVEVEADRRRGVESEHLAEDEAPRDGDAEGPPELENAGHPGATVSAVEGRGNQRAWGNQVRGIAYAVSLLSRARVEVVVKDEDASQIVQAIRDAALTGEVGDGKIFIHGMADAIGIRTNESGMAAL